MYIVIPDVRLILVGAFSWERVHAYKMLRKPSRRAKRTPHRLALTQKHRAFLITTTKYVLYTIIFCRCAHLAWILREILSATFVSFSLLSCRASTQEKNNCQSLSLLAIFMIMTVRNHYHWYKKYIGSEREREKRTASSAMLKQKKNNSCFRAKNLKQ